MTTLFCIPAGWRLVPEEPTPAMLEAVRNADLDIYWSYCADERPGTAKDVYRVMLSAAPTIEAAQ